TPERGDAAVLRQCALNLLARREHSPLELRHKLTQRGFDPDRVDVLLSELQDQDLLNETRYAEVYAHARVDRGYGPLRIKSELLERGVSPAVVKRVLGQLEEIWMAKLSQVQRKRFGASRPYDAAAQAQQTRFLRYRGFTLEQISQLFRNG
ncbi:MAG: regulatory protein RecX, partial [Candidatus Competibacterales bacterium]